MSLPEEALPEQATPEQANAEETPAAEQAAEGVAEQALAESAAPNEPEQGVLVDVSVEREELSPEELLPEDAAPEKVPVEDAELKAVLEAIIYVTDEPLTLDQICTAIEQPRERVIELLEQLAADYERPDRGLTIKEVAGGFKMSTKPEHHESVRRFVKNLNPPLKLSLPALETLAVIAYKQPITAPEIMEIRGVQGAGVLKTLIDRKLIATAGRKQVVGKPILYKTTKEFLVQFGLRDLNELPTLKEFQEIGRMDTETAPELSPVEQQEPLPPIEPAAQADEAAPVAPDAQVEAPEQPESTPEG
ncbi:MAG: SMC-Scp complex subunit ScpB [Acidobacteriota bacterium]|nr:SMC-Scp complex subunit ScpB [Acidobacteriota bacterium]